MRKLPIEIL